MPNRIYLSVLAVSLLFCPSVYAELKPFLADSMQQIITARHGKPFLLVLWSTDCPPCLQEFKQLQQLKEVFSPQRLVLISTDSPDNQQSVNQLLTEFELDRFDNWIFGDNFPERLRYQIDPAWYGELPRSYMYAAGHQRTAHSGILSNKFLETWLLKQSLNDRPL